LLWSCRFFQEPIRVTFAHFGIRTTGAALCILVIRAAVALAYGQTQPDAESPTQSKTAAVQGHVRDSSGKPVADVNIVLQHSPNTTTTPGTRTTRSDSEGTFHFSGLSEGAYSVRAEVKAGGLAAVSLVNLRVNETNTIDLVLMPEGSSGAQAPVPSQSLGSIPPSIKPEFFDEPQFTVAGVTQATTAGGHGSDTVLRNSEAIVKATVSLGKESETKESPDRKSAADDSATTNSTRISKLREERAELQAKILRSDNDHGDTASEKIPADNSRSDQRRERQSDLHHELAQIEEKLGNPLEAVREYQRASELTPSEPHLFDWASELLAHRALEPATEVFTQGNRLYPQSVRMLIGLGVAWYARGSDDRAAQYLGAASDLDPADPTPYLFMGKMQSAETVPSRETLERLARFERLRPGDALAHYHYAVGLWKSKQSAGGLDEAGSAQVEALLQKAVQLDPKLGAAHLQLGILYGQRGDYARAISSYQKAIEVCPDLEETHYRLAQAYRRTGDEANAEEELQLHEQLSKQSKAQAERERRDIQQFVISLRDRSSQ
jgi:tetratricopeptide (TPR) repeat protein